MLDVGEPPRQPLSGRAAVFVFSSSLDKVLFAKPHFPLAPDVSDLGTRGVIPASSQARISSPLK